MRARLIVTTIVMAGLALAVGAIALAGKPAPPSTSQYPDLQGRGAGSPQPREPAAARVSALLERDREHGPGPWALRPDRTSSGRAATTTAIQEIRSSNAQYLCGTQPKPSDPVLHGPLGARSSRSFEYHADAQPLAHRRRRAVRGSAGEPDNRTGRGRELDQGRLLPPRPLQARRKCPDEREGVLGLLHELPGRSSGWVDQYHQATDGQQVELTGRPERERTTTSSRRPTPDGCVPRAGHDEQHARG